MERDFPEPQEPSLSTTVPWTRLDSAVIWAGVVQQCCALSKHTAILSLLLLTREFPGVLHIDHGVLCALQLFCH